jgi:hypothetical protein
MVVSFLYIRKKLVLSAIEDLENKTKTKKKTVNVLLAPSQERVVERVPSPRKRNDGNKPLPITLDYLDDQQRCRHGGSSTEIGYSSIYSS